MYLFGRIYDTVVGKFYGKMDKCDETELGTSDINTGMSRNRLLDFKLQFHRTFPFFHLSQNYQRSCT